jgi:hypothetical protein
MQLLYNPGTQSALIPVDFSAFNPGTYQSEESGFDTALTVNLIIEPVPEPSALALAVVAIFGAVLTRKKVTTTETSFSGVIHEPQTNHTQ